MIFLVVLLFILGLLVGSFLNALLYRLHSGESVMKGRSKCPKCSNQLKTKDLIPLISFFVLKGKCRDCGTKISWQYPIVEFTTGILFALAAWNFLPESFTAAQLGYFIFVLFSVSILIVIFVYDLKHYLILDKVVFPSIVVAFLFALFLPQISIFGALLGSVVIGGFFLVLVLLSKEKWMGWGDVKLGFLLGLLIPWPMSLVLLFIAFVGGSLISLLLMGLKIKGLKDAVPFGTFLTAATVVTFFFGQSIIDWYLRLLG